MRVLIGYFATEVNEHIGVNTELDSYTLAFGEEVIDKMHLRSLIEQEHIEAVGSIYAKSSPNGIIKENDFKVIEEELLYCLKKNLFELDGAYFHLHGASYVENIGSGDFHILKKIREIVGPYFPIAISCDPHGNLNNDYINNLQIIRSYRESPHTDMLETWKLTLKQLIDLLRNREDIHPVYRKLPIILGGEQSVSSDEPVASINKYLNILEKDPRIRTACWHVGYLRHDCSEAGSGITVTPMKLSDTEYAKQMADNLAKLVIDKHHEFHYTGTSCNLDDALKMAYQFSESPFVITDSGDNTTSGALGHNTEIIRKVLESKTNKKWLFASIVDPVCVKELRKYKVNDIVDINIGSNLTKLSQLVPLKVKILDYGRVVRTASFAIGQDDIIGEIGYTVLVRVVHNSLNIDCIIADHKQSYYKTVQFEAAKINNWKQYDVVVVKQGYIFPELKEGCKDWVMALTNGATLQNTKALDFKLIKHPMYPFEEI